ncbi:HAMP domain-containing histidine kinase [Seonamhaeicola algicola]|uniref:HAMP domain-containing histidine kinase n=1 Tax=Seonamhaeicola algicola TaxID=1719036 RepID=A0A5C7AZL1_9FLAO|nr:HAMP domain-containing histidine kinase [Seonamhaeicola algicola]TXE13173.1 HAMP domain-containing histidine kinase [Seonamhaeicola algicola]
MLLNNSINKTVSDIAFWELKDNDTMLWSEAFLSNLDASLKANQTLKSFLNNTIHTKDSLEFEANFLNYIKNGIHFKQRIQLKGNAGIYNSFICSTKHNFFIKPNKTSQYLFFHKQAENTSDYIDSLISDSTPNVFKHQSTKSAGYNKIALQNVKSHASNLTLVSELVNTFTISQPKNSLNNTRENTSKVIDDVVSILSDIKQNPTDKTVSFNNILCQVLISISPVIIDANAKIDSDFSKLKSINTKAEYIERILLNLITYAIHNRHSHKHPKVYIHSYLENNKPVLEITDNGIDINANELCAKTTHKMEGILVIENQKNTSTTFKIFL